MSLLHHHHLIQCISEKYNLPNGYIPIEYLQNTASGGQLINIPFDHAINQSFTIKIDFIRKANTTGYSRVAYNQLFTFWVKNGGIVINYRGKETTITSTQAPLNVRSYIIFKNGQFKTSWGYNGTAAAGTGTSATYINLFTNTQYNRSGVNSICGLTIWDNNNKIIHELTPVRVGNVGYMYDYVTQTLYGNSGSGSFVLGPDI